MNASIGRTNERYLISRSPTSFGKNLATNFSFPLADRVFEYEIAIITRSLDQ
jgi:hypothetical protein